MTIRDTNTQPAVPSPNLTPLIFPWPAMFTAGLLMAMRPTNTGTQR